MHWKDIEVKWWQLVETAKQLWVAITREGAFRPSGTYLDDVFFGPSFATVFILITPTRTTTSPSRRNSHE